MRVFLAVLMGLAILWLGSRLIGSLARLSPKEEIEPEDVQDLDVILRCTECGTELRVEKLGQLQIPRHCGEPMSVERRRASAGP